MADKVKKLRDIEVQIASLTEELRIMLNSAPHERNSLQISTIRQMREDLSAIATELRMPYVPG